MRSPIVRIGLQVITVAVLPVNVYVLFVVKKNMRGLVEQAEPEVVVRFVACAQRNNRLAPGEPPGSAAQPRIFGNGFTSASATPASLQSLLVSSRASWNGLGS